MAKRAWWHFRKRPSETKETAKAISAAMARQRELPMSGDRFVPGLGLQIYDRMQTDAQVRASLNLKKLGVLAAPWSIVPADGCDAARRIADFVRFSLSQMRGSVGGILWKSLDACAKGYAVLELNYELRNDEPYAGLLLLQEAKAKDPSLFGFQVDEFLNIRSLQLNVPGELPVSLRRDKFVLYVYNAHYESPWGEPDLRAAYPHWFAKTALLRFWSVYLEKFGSPTVMGTYKRGLPPEAQDELLAALEKLQQETALVVPEDVKVQLMNGLEHGAQGYLEAVEYHNAEIARSILGQTLTTDEGRRVGSLALGVVHFHVMLLQLQALRRELAEIVMTEQVIRPLVELNFQTTLIPRFVFDETSLQSFVTGNLQP